MPGLSLYESDSSAISPFAAADCRWRATDIYRFDAASDCSPGGSYFPVWYRYTFWRSDYWPPDGWYLRALHPLPFVAFCSTVVPQCHSTTVRCSILAQQAGKGKAWNKASRPTRCRACVTDRGDAIFVTSVDGRRPDWFWTGVSPEAADAPGVLPDGTVTALPLPDLSRCTRQSVLDYFNNCWLRTEVLFSGLQGTAPSTATPIQSATSAAAW